MKKLRVLPILLALGLLATACGGIPGEADHVALEEEILIQGAVHAGEATWNYAITTYSVSGDYCADDGRVLSHHSYQMPRMQVTDAKKDSGAARQAADAFNSYFAELQESEKAWFREIGAIAAEDYAAAGHLADSRWQDGAFFYRDETTLELWANAQLLCVTTNRYSYTGGAHPAVWRTCDTFDLRTGKAISVAELAEDTTLLHDAVERELLAQAQARLADTSDAPAYYEDYEKTLGDWMDRALAFDGAGMTVIFGVYDLAPYAAGEQSFLIPYEYLAPYLNALGKTLLERDS